VSVREDMACSILRDIGPRFKQTLLCTDPLFIRRLLDEAQVAGVDWKALNTSVIVGEEVLVEAQRDYIAARMGIDLDRDPHRLIGSSFGVGELGLNLLFETRETIRMRRAMRSHPELAEILGGKAGGLEMPSLFCFNPLRSYVEVLNPDADGFGELCITMLDRQAIIPLPRYATGDLGKVLPREQAVLASRLAGSEAPWLPMVAVRGRIKDRPAGYPSVEAVKELLYRDHAVADQLTGAFRIWADSAGTVRLTLQANSDATASAPGLLDRLTAIFDPEGPAPMVVEVVTPTAFAWRPMLDYERKFAYVDA
jgi:phenylacetate-CoA ligase